MRKMLPLRPYDKRRDRGQVGICHVNEKEVIPQKDVQVNCCEIVSTISIEFGG